MAQGPTTNGKTAPKARTAPKAKTSVTPQMDAEALKLRSAGRGYGAIARALELDGTKAAVAAFNRGLRQETKTRQQAIRREERKRLDASLRKAQENPDFDDADRERRRKAVEWHRAQLDAD